MSWVLFCQIEVILLTVGLVVSFIFSSRQSVKDNSFFKRFNLMTKGFAEASTALLNTFNANNVKKENNQNDK